MGPTPARPPRTVLGRRLGQKTQFQALPTSNCNLPSSPTGVVQLLLCCLLPPFWPLLCCTGHFFGSLPFASRDRPAWVPSPAPVPGPPTSVPDVCATLKWALICGLPRTKVALGSPPSRNMSSAAIAAPPSPWLGASPPGSSPFPLSFTAPTVRAAPAPLGMGLLTGLPSCTWFGGRLDLCIILEPSCPPTKIRTT
jgi:hypothetical protein